MYKYGELVLKKMVHNLVHTIGNILHARRRNEFVINILKK
jgi:hypothetical protein